MVIIVYYKCSKIALLIMSQFGIAVAQSCTFIAMLILLGVLAWHECDLTEFQVTLIIIVFIMAAGTISVLLGHLSVLA